MYGNGILASEYDAWRTASVTPDHLDREPQPINFEPFAVVGPGHQDYFELADLYRDDAQWCVIDTRIKDAWAPFSSLAARFDTDEPAARAFAAEQNALAQAAMSPPRFDVAEFTGEPDPWAVMDYVDCRNDDYHAVAFSRHPTREQAQARCDELIGRLRAGDPVPRTDVS